MIKGWPQQVASREIAIGNEVANSIVAGSMSGRHNPLAAADGARSPSLCRLPTTY